MQVERDADEQDNAPDPGPMPPLYGTRESAAGLPSTASGGDIARAAGLAPPPSKTLARPSTRLWARLLDIACCGVVLLVVQTALWVVIMMNDPALRGILLASPEDPLSQQEISDLQTAIAPWAWLSTAVLLLVWFLYEVPLTALRGQTLGKLALGIRVSTGVPAARVGWRAAISRWAVLALPGILGLIGLPFQMVDCGWLLKDKARPRCLHDHLARTDVATALPHRPQAE